MHPGLSQPVGSEAWSVAYHEVIALHWGRAVELLRIRGHESLAALRDSLAARVPDPYPTPGVVARQILAHQGRGHDQQEASTDDPDWYDSPEARLLPEEMANLDMSSLLTDEGDRLVRFRLAIVGWVLDDYVVRGVIADYTSGAGATLPDPVLYAKTIVARLVLEHIDAGSPTAVMEHVAKSLGDPGAERDEVLASLDGVSDKHLKDRVWVWAGCKRGRTKAVTSENLVALQKWAESTVEQGREEGYPV